MNYNADLHACLDALRKGGTILYPTDTIWGLGCDATQAGAVEKIYAIKERDPSKSMIILVSDVGMLNRFVKSIPAIAWDLMEAADHPLTIIYDGCRNLAPNVPAADGTIGVRMVNDDFCQALLRKLGKPIVSTSANFSGKPSPSNFSEIDPQLQTRVDYVVQWRQNDFHAGRASSIIRIKENGEFRIIRP